MATSANGRKNEKKARRRPPILRPIGRGLQHAGGAGLLNAFTAEPAKLPNCRGLDTPLRNPPAIVPGAAAAPHEQKRGWVLRLKYHWSGCVLAAACAVTA